MLKQVIKKIVPAGVYLPVLKRFRGPARVRWGELRRTEPISRQFGFERGTPIDRYYIDRFLAKHAEDIRGEVLEIGDASYTNRFGGARVTRSHVLHALDGNPRATMVGDLVSGRGIPPDLRLDCIILTQVLHFIYDMRGAMKTVCRLLKPGGVLFATFPGIAQISRYDMDRWGECWRMTSMAAAKLFEEIFGPGAATVQSHGNVLVAVAFLHGLAQEDLDARELDRHDPDYETLITVRAVKAN